MSADSLIALRESVCTSLVVLLESVDTTPISTLVLSPLQNGSFIDIEIPCNNHPLKVSDFVCFRVEEFAHPDVSVKVLVRQHSETFEKYIREFVNYFVPIDQVDVTNRLLNFLLSSDRRDKAMLSSLSERLRRLLLFAENNTEDLSGLSLILKDYPVTRPQFPDVIIGRSTKLNMGSMTISIPLSFGALSEILHVVVAPHSQELFVDPDLFPFTSLNSHFILSNHISLGVAYNIINSIILLSDHIGDEDRKLVERFIYLILIDDPLTPSESSFSEPAIMKYSSSAPVDVVEFQELIFNIRNWFSSPAKKFNSSHLRNSYFPTNGRDNGGSSVFLLPGLSVAMSALTSPPAFTQNSFYHSDDD